MCSRICNEGSYTAENKQQTLQSSGSVFVRKNLKDLSFSSSLLHVKNAFSVVEIAKERWENVRGHPRETYFPPQSPPVIQKDTEGVFLHENLIFLWSQNHIIMVMAPALLH